MRTEFSHLVPIYRAMQPLRAGRYSVVVTEEIKSCLVCILSDDDNVGDSGLSCRVEPEGLVVGDTIEFDVAPPKIGLGVFAETFDEFLSKPRVLVRESKNYFIRGLHFSSRDEHVPGPIVAYRSVLDFVRLLKSVCYFFDAQTDTFVFHKDGRFDLPVKYSSDDLFAFDSASIRMLDRTLSDDLHATQKKKILAETVVEICEAVEPELRFAALLKGAVELVAKFQTGYDLFSTDFTFEKAKQEVHTFSIESTARLHKIISEIQAQVLGIPVASFLALSQLKKTTVIGSQFAINSIIMLGVLIFCILLAGILYNQHLTLNAIELDVKRQKDVFARKFSLLPSTYEGVFRNLCSRLVFQYFAVYFVAALNVVVLLVSVVYFILHTRPIYEWLF